LGNDDVDTVVAGCNILGYNVAVTMDDIWAIETMSVDVLGDHVLGDDEVHFG
jgi:hypothetical protein